MSNEPDKKAGIPDISDATGEKEKEESKELNREGNGSSSDAGPDKLREADYWKQHGLSSSTPLSKSSATDVFTPISTPVAAQRPPVAPRRPQLPPKDKTTSGVQVSSHTAWQSQGDKSGRAQKVYNAKTGQYTDVSPSVADSNSPKTNEKEKEREKQCEAAEPVSDTVNNPDLPPVRQGTLAVSIDSDGRAQLPGVSPQCLAEQQQALNMLRRNSMSEAEQLALVMQMSIAESSSSSTDSRSNTYYSPAMFQSTPTIGQRADGMEGSNGSGASTPESDAEQSLPIPVGDDADSDVEAGNGEKEKEKEIDDCSFDTPCP